ncbi:hypothetical protein NC653_035619 [Populus alba x Populus x berolinensis]|uniref:Uncharacterized protein n=1 Tax=Populus alba x Populus x berolinensis TaxID=444605 RepID=A0AAD6PTY5_9ROSI|nr:hypothetical protein NC653_035619 [Populus alba x Populus x berolinensis]
MSGEDDDANEAKKIGVGKGAKKEVKKEEDTKGYRRWQLHAKTWRKTLEGASKVLLEKHCSRHRRLITIWRCPALLLIFFPSTDTNRKAVVAMPPSHPHTCCIIALEGWDCFGLVMPATPLLLLHLLRATSSLDCVKSRNSHKSPSET